ncbi:MAG: hypothetical protein JOY80_08955, partial [Candidatus Dormibacteraeota bacterium]|nr:hypothetical protein [Candidatus Dormibacteraeota bacterium]
PAAPGALAVPQLAVSPAGRQIVYLAEPAGVLNAYVENADGSHPLALTSFAAGTFEATAVSVNG